MDLSIFSNWRSPFVIYKGVSDILFHFYLIFGRRMYANSVDPDKMPLPHPAASDLGLHCLPMSQKWDARDNMVHVFHGFQGIFFYFEASQSKGG